MRQLRTVMMVMLAVAWAFCAACAGTNSIAWVDDFDEALRHAARENKFIVLDISASW